MNRYFQIAPGSYVVKVLDSQGILHGRYAVAPGLCPQPTAGFAMTWSALYTNPTNGVVLVGCGNTCDPYLGDTACTAVLPLLCILKTGPGFPLPIPASVDNSDIYDQWSGGVIGTTRAVQAPTTLAAANALCVAEFGAGWRFAEFHDGWGFNFQAFGGVGDANARFWVDIDDQPAATCWR